MTNDEQILHALADIKVWGDAILNKCDVLKGYMVPSVVEPVSQPEPAPRPAAWYHRSGHLVVGKGKAPPAGDVVIEVLGSTAIPVRAFNMAIGCNPAALTLVKAEVAPELLDLLGDMVNHVYKVAAQGAQGGVGDFISLFVGFFNKSQAPIDTLIPDQTPLVRLDFKVSETPIVQRYDLTNRSAYYGRKFENPDGSSSRILVENMYGTDPVTLPGGARPELVSGWVDVA